MRLIILAAGQGYQLDGFNKLLIRDPHDNKEILEKYIIAFPDTKITVVVGYRAINVMEKYPEFDYVYNPDWAVTNNSYSLGLALSEEPCFVISGDLLIEPELVDHMNNCGPDIVMTADRQNRTMNAINVSIDTNKRIREVYQGKLTNPYDPEAVGIFKISSANILREWHKNCMKYRNLFAAQNLPFQTDIPIIAETIGEHRLHEINTPLDYIQLMSLKKTW